MNSIKAQAKSSWLTNAFDTTKWSFDNQVFSSESFYVAELLASLISDEEIGEKCAKKVEKALDTLTKSTLYNGKSQAFFISNDLSIDPL